MVRRIDNDLPRDRGLVRRGSQPRTTDTRWSSRGVTAEGPARRQRVARRTEQRPAVVEVNRVQRSFDKPIEGKFAVYHHRESEPLGQYINAWV